MPCPYGFYTLTGVSPHDTPKITTLPGPCLPEAPVGPVPELRAHAFIHNESRTEGVNFGNSGLSNTPSRCILLVRADNEKRSC